METAPLDALYHTNPGRGLEAPVEEMLIIEPPWPCWINRPINAFDARKMLRTLTLNTRSHSSSVTSKVGCRARTSAKRQLNKMHTDITHRVQASSTAAVHLIVRTLFRYVVPALFTSTSNRPNLANARSMTSSQSEALVTSILWKSRFSGFCAAIFCPFSTLISVRMTLAPSSPKRREMAAPKPEPPPI